MISLVMGLIVALAAVALAKASTTTFHEQARSSLTEMSVRSGAERLRQDLLRISFMSTANIARDDSVAHVVGGPNSRYTYFNFLQGIRINVNGSATTLADPNGLNATNGVSPDSIDITGNMTTDDVYHGTIQSGGSCGGQTVTLDPLADAAVYQMIGPGAPATGAQAAFRPVPGRNFIARVTDPNGCNHFVPVCDVTTTSAAGRTMAVIHLQPDADGRAVLYAVNGTGGTAYAVDNNCGASEGGEVAIAPVQRVRWALTQSPAGLETDPVGGKFDLTRQFLDAEGAAAGAPEIVAEYAVDLKFGIILRDPTAAALGGTGETVFDLDTDPGNGNIYKAVGGVEVNPLGPQHVRSVRFRLATRVSISDREADITVGAATRPYMARYCLEGPLGDCRKFARVRTVISEVALHNQARVFY